MAKKKVAAIIKIQIPAGKATPAPPVGTALGPHGVGSWTSSSSTTRPPSRRSARSSRSRSRSSRIARSRFILKTPPTPVLLRQKAGLAKGSHDAGQDHRRHRHRGRHRRGRQDQDARPQRLRPRGRQGAGPRHRPLDGPQGRLTAAISRQLHSSSHTHTRSSGTPRPAALTPRETAHVRQEVHRRDEEVRPRSAVHAHRGARRWSSRWPSAKFDETVEFAVRLGVDPRKADQMVRGTVALPSGTGKDVRVAVFAAGEAAAGRPRRRRRHSSVPTTWPPRSRRATWTSTWPSPRPT